jgi:hypothetical protein
MSDTFAVATPYSIFLTGIAIFMLIISGIMYIYNASKREKSKEKSMLVAFGFWFFAYAFFCLFYCFLIQFQLVMVYKDGVFYGTLENPPALFYIFHRLAFVVFMIGCFVLYSTMERLLKKTKYSLSILTCILLIIDLCLPWELHFEYNVYNAIMFIELVIFYFLMILLAKKSSIEFKTIAIVMIGGMTLLALGIIFMSVEILSLNLFLTYLGAIAIMAGCFVFISPMIIKPKLFSDALRYWYFFGFIQSSIIIGLAIFFVLFFPFQIKVISTIVAFINVFLIYMIIKDIKSQQSIYIISTKTTKTTPSSDFLRSFTKPEMITEEEVTISKEKRICLVCKGKISRHNYVCPECETFYCNKCYNALTNLENACWECDTQFDVAKPVKSFEKEEELEEIEISERPQKKSKNKRGGTKWQKST